MPTAGMPTDVSLGDGVSCDGEGCVAPMADGRFVALSLKPDGLADDCARAALIVTARPAPPACEAAVIELKRLARARRNGASLDASAGSSLMRSSQEERTGPGRQLPVMPRPTGSLPSEPPQRARPTRRRRRRSFRARTDAPSAPAPIRRRRDVRGSRRCCAVRTHQGETHRFRSVHPALPPGTAQASEQG